MLTKLDQYFERLKAIKSAEKSPDLTKLIPFQIDNRTTLYFKYDSTDEYIKERIKQHIIHSERFIKAYRIPEEVIRTNSNKYKE